jgi:hypothetical protein
MQDMRHVHGSSLCAPGCIPSPTLFVMLSPFAALRVNSAKHLVALRDRSFALLSMTTGETHRLFTIHSMTTGETHSLFAERSECAQGDKATRRTHAPDLYTRIRPLAANSPLAKASLRHIHGPSRIPRRNIPYPHRCIEYR